MTHPISGSLNVTSLDFQRVVIYGAEDEVAAVTVDGSSVDTFTFVDNLLVVYDLSMSIDKPHNLVWSSVFL